ncbi:disease resistance protein RUN1-like isoform X2 [Pyrus communis]|uniref:disease resistance protein RUN1-like isoform X2 n=1 Tax=Pyrus communis TaxID=23211 RepID=UPI0035C0D3F4
MASSSSKCRTYDVFLSFRGDTRRNLTDYLARTLENHGFYVFLDENNLTRGEPITPALKQAIKDSRLAAIIFSRAYAESRWCLEELVEILACKETMGLMVLPIFYDIDPNRVRHQTHDFDVAFQRHQERFSAERVLTWRNTLNAAAELAGEGFSATAGYEGRFVQQIVDEIARKLKNTYLTVAPNPVGIDSRVQEIGKYLDDGGLDDVRIIGIWGMGGLGKTTVAKAIFNEYQDKFAGRSFLANVREEKLVDSQNTLLYDVLRLRNIKVSRVDEGTEDIKRRLGNLRVLVIVDGVDSVKQLEALAIKRDSFGPGSRIIITTRDKHLLEILKADTICHLPAMNTEEALELLSWHAFSKNYPNNEYLKVSREVVDYCGGLPLALHVLGSHLFTRSTREWESALKKWKRSRPYPDIHQNLKISYDGIKDDDVKSMFLDISCFFIGMNKDYVMKILDPCDEDRRDQGATIGIRELHNQCLVTVDTVGNLMMHGLIRDTGREIVREKSPDIKGKRSRLWDHEDVIHVLKTRTSLEKLKILNLGYCNSLERSPNFSKIPNLERLILECCKNLQAIPNLPKNLEILEADECIALQEMPNFSKMSRMRELHLNHSPKLTEISGLHKSLNSMTRIHMEGCTNLNADFRKKILQGWCASGYGGLFLPGNEIPSWFMPVDPRVEIFVPQSFGCDLKALTVCIIYSSDDSQPAGSLCIRVANCTQNTEFLISPMRATVITTHENYLWLGHLSNNKLNVKGGDRIIFYAHFVGPTTTDDIHLRVQKIGINLEKEKLINEYALDCQSMPYSSECKEDGNLEAGHNDDSSHENQSLKRLSSDPSVERNAEEETDEIMQEGRTRGC